MFGIIFVLLIIELSGCVDQQVNEQTNQFENNIISFEELYGQLEQYIGKNVTIEGYVEHGMGKNISLPYATSFCDSNLSNPNYCVLLYVPTNVIIYMGRYRITGMAGEHNDTSIPTIDVISAEKLSIG